MTPDIDALIAEVTGVTGSEPRLTFDGVTGVMLGIDEMDWIFHKDGQERKVTLPRAAITFERLGPKINAWRIEMTAAAAREFGVADMATGKTGEKTL